MKVDKQKFEDLLRKLAQGPAAPKKTITVANPKPKSKKAPAKQQRP